MLELDPELKPVHDPVAVFDAMGISRNSGYAAIASGAIPSIRIGRRILVPTAQLRHLLRLDAIGDLVTLDASDARAAFESIAAALGGQARARAFVDDLSVISKLERAAR